MTYRTDRPADDASMFIEVQLQNRETLVTGTMQSFNTDKVLFSLSTSPGGRIQLHLRQLAHVCRTDRGTRIRRGRR
jgi:hypothetical protein